MFKFFNSLLKDGQVINLSLMKCGDKMTVGVHPQSPGTNDDAQSLIIPLVFTGTPEELDEQFFAKIAAPVGEAAGLLSNMEEFSKSLEKASAESKAAKEASSKTNKLLKDAEDLEKNGKSSEALVIYKKVLESDKSNPKAKAKIGELRQTDMFAEESDMVDEKEGAKLSIEVKPAEKSSPAFLTVPNELPKQENREQSPVTDMFAELMSTSVKTGLAPREEPASFPQPDEALSVRENADISAEEWQQFQQFQKFQASLNGNPAK